jgi:protein gp37
MGRSSIEWTDETWNPVTRCVKLSPGCKYCYAELRRALPRGRRSPIRGRFDPTLRPDRIDHPKAWRTPRRVFVNSMSDLFGEFVPSRSSRACSTQCEHAAAHVPGADEARRSVAPMTNTRNRGSLQCRISGWACRSRIGSTVPRIDRLRRATAARRFLSVEPLLEDIGAVDLTGIDWVIVPAIAAPGRRKPRRRLAVRADHTATCARLEQIERDRPPTSSLVTTCASKSTRRSASTLGHERVRAVPIGRDQDCQGCRRACRHGRRNQMLRVRHKPLGGRAERRADQ